MKFAKLIIISFMTIVFSSCEDKSTSFGTVEYYPPFLWAESETRPVTKIFEFDFSQDAQNDPRSFAEFQFVDNEGRAIGTDILLLSIDGQQLKDNRFKVDSKVKSKEVTFSFAPQARSGKYQGFLRLVSHNLDRIDAQQLSPGQEVDAFQWTLQYEKSMNPLAKGLMWAVIIIVSCFLLWFIFLRPALCPHFGKFTKSILIEKEGVIVGQLNYSFKGARRVVFYNKKEKQSLLKRLFVGETRTLVNPNFSPKLTFVPQKRGAAAYGTEYSVKPNPIPRSSIATITNNRQKLTITLR